MASIGLPLLGLRVFHASDLLQTFAPWRAEAAGQPRPTNPLVTDTVNAVVPMRAEFRRRALEGDLGLWTSLPSGGAPLGTVPDVGPFSPLNLPYLVTPLSYAPGASKLLELSVAIGFMFLFLRRVGVRPSPAVAGGLLFAFSGFQVVWTNWPQSHVGALIPALFWATERAIQERTLRGSLPVALVFAAMLLEGFPAVAGYAVVAAGAYGVVRLFASRDASVGSRAGMLGSLALAAVLGAGLAGAHLLPFFDRLSHLDLAYREQLTEHLPFRALVTLVIPNAFGSPVDRNYVGRWNYVELQSFIGAAAVVFILVAALRSTRRVGAGVRGYFWGAAGVVLVMIYLGGPLLSLAQHTPLFSSSLVGRMRSVFGFFLAALAAIGIDAAAEEPSGERRGWWTIAKRFAVGGGAIFMLVGAWRVWRIAERSGIESYVLRRSIVPVVAGGVTIAALAARRFRWGGRSIVIWVAPVVIAAEILAFATPFWARIPPEQFYPRTVTHDFLSAHLGSDRFAAEGRTMLTGTTTLYGLRSVSAKVFADRTWKEAITAADPQAFRVPTWPFFEATAAVATSPVFDRLAVRYFVADPARPVIGRPSADAPVGGFVELLAGRTLEAAVPTGDIRALVLQFSGRYTGTDDRVSIAAELLDGSGAVISRGVRRLEPGQQLGPFEIAVVQPPAGSPRGARARVTLLSRDGSIEVVGDDAGSASISAVLAAADGLRVAFADGTVIYERTRALPRVRWAGTSRVVPEARDRLAALSSVADANTVVLNERAPEGSNATAVLQILRDEGGALRASVDAAGAGYVVVADAMQHGWRATVDRRPAPILPADHAGVAVYVQAGKHQVELQYRPAAWRWGIAVSIASGVVMILLIVVGTRRARAGTSQRVGLNGP